MLSKLPITTPYKYVFSFAVLISVFAMLIIAKFYLHTYQYESKKTKSNLTTERTLLISMLAQNIPLNNLYQLHKNSPIFIEHRPIPASLQETLSKPKQLSKGAIQELGWGQYGITPNMLITVIPLDKKNLIISALINQESLPILFAQTILYLVIINFIIILIYSFIISSHMRRRISQIDNTAQQILQGDMRKRIPILTKRRDEYTHLSQTLNQMLDKINILMKDLRQVNNNIAHDLKSPINRLRSRMEVALLQSRSPDEYQTILAQSIDDLDELLNTFNALLLMGNLDSKARNYQLKFINISDLLIDLGDFYGAIAEEKNHQLQLYIQDNVIVLANRNLLAQAISNLLENAIKYTPNGGLIELTLKTQQSIALIIISDNGIGIPAQDKEKVFQRFTRLEQSRNLSGNGLGMSLVQAILTIHKASIELKDNQPGLLAEIKIHTEDTEIP
ncbi:MAG: sensor histidine kinase [Ostreibacterium sp.]